MALMSLSIKGETSTREPTHPGSLRLMLYLRGEGVSTPEMGVHCIAHCGIAFTIACIAQSIARVAGTAGANARIARAISTFARSTACIA